MASTSKFPLWAKILLGVVILAAIVVPIVLLVKPKSGSGSGGSGPPPSSGSYGACCAPRGCSDNTSGTQDCNYRFDGKFYPGKYCSEFTCPSTPTPTPTPTPPVPRPEPAPVYGCTDPTALNFDPNATIDNGTCVDRDPVDPPDDGPTPPPYNPETDYCPKDPKTEKTTCDWHACAEYNELCKCPSRKVRLGGDGRWSGGGDGYPQDVSPIPCNVEGAGKGEDPAPGYRKRCQCWMPNPWPECGKEYGTCKSCPSQKVRYGADGRWVERTFDSKVNIPCDNGTFGTDPAPSFNKTCQCWTPPPGW